MTPVGSKTSRPPRILRTLLRALNRGDVFLAMIGDFDEEFREIAASEGPPAACRWYRRQFFRSLPGSLKENFLWRSDMLKNYFLLAVRNIRRQKALSAINILGLSIALACSLWIYLFVSHEISYDRFHANAGRIYSVINTDNYYPFTYRSAPRGVAAAMEEFFPEVEKAARIVRARGVIQNGADLSREDIYLADPDFFELFSFRFISGARSALADKSAILLTRSAAAAYFGREEPLDRILTISTDRNTNKEFRVAGVLEDPPTNSSIQFQFLVAFDNMDFFWGPDALNLWSNSGNQTYVRLRPGASAAAVDARFPDFVRRYFSQVIEMRKARGLWKKDGETITFWLQNIRDIHLHSQEISEGPPRSSASKSGILGTIGLLLLLVSGINFANLAAGRASRRSVEIAMRRVLGAERRNLLRQFWGESVVTVALSMLTGFLLAALFLPLFNSLSGKSFRPPDFAALSVAGLAVLLTLVVGTLAGSFPALVMAGVNPVRIFKGDRKIGGKNRISRFLIVVQFSIAVLLLISTVTMSRQIRFIQERDLGYDTRDLLVIDNQDRDPVTSNQSYRLFRERASALASVKAVGGCELFFADIWGEGTWTYKGRPIHCNFTRSSPGYFETLGISFKEGADFKDRYPDGATPVIVNERYVRLAGIPSPIGEIINETGPPLQIVGVVKDYHYMSLHSDIPPVIHFLSPRTSTILVRIAQGAGGGTIAGLQSIWKELRPDRPFIYRFTDSLISSHYKEDRRWNAIVRTSSLLVILINCMGLVGLTTTIVGRRVKEVGVRRVLGASRASLCVRLSGDFLRLGGLSNLIAWPVGYLVMRRWLNQFPFRSALPVDAFLIAGLLSFAVILVTIGFLVHKTASANPSETLRYN